MEKDKLIEQLKIEHPNDIHFDCLSCSYSFSNDENQLFCSLHSKWVEEDYLCEDFN